MHPDALGFLYPKVDIDLCVDCGLCDKVCSFNDNYSKSSDFQTPIPYGVRHRDMKTLMSSQSGGAFTALSDTILERGGIVYGAGWNDQFEVIHRRACTKEERNALRGSKYVQSNLNGVFTCVRQDLKDGKEVLFSGTPCQVAGLKSFIDSRLSVNLTTVDIICHGVPSPLIFKEYLKYLTDKYAKGRKLTKVIFRDKQRFGHQMYGESYLWENICHRDIDYSYMFCKDIILRQSCANCHFCNLERCADISIGDFWGWKNVDKTFNSDDKGVSLVLINSIKGKTLFDFSKKNLFIIKPNLKDCMQSHLMNPSKLSKLRGDFEDTYIKYGFKTSYFMYGKADKLYLLKRRIRLIYNSIKRMFVNN